jgi:hypothetical protein
MGIQPGHLVLMKDYIVQLKPKVVLFSSASMTDLSVTARG